jgi:N-acetylgalactosamine-N,N'-diacetylbacillosaminyl-diphospho-undecaprenol 4-alpha-N-acetylgalactosaminyltransferase
MMAAVLMSERELNLLIVVIDLHGGCGVFCRTLAKALRQHHPGNVHVDLLVLRDKGFIESDAECFSRITITRQTVSTNWRRLLQPILHATRLRREIRRLAPDVILTVSTYANLVVPRVAGGIPCVLSEHVNVTSHLRDARFPRIIRALMRWTYPSRVVVGPTDGVTDDLRDNFNVTRATTIPHGIDGDAIRSSADAEPREPERVGGDYIVACGRLTPQKDYPTLLRAFAIARSRGVDGSLCIVGDGEQRPTLEALARELGIADQVRFTGHLDNPFPVMKRARFLVLSSIWEGFGLVLLEAMALGLPVISTDCPSGPSEILRGGKSGVLVPVGDVEALASRMVELWTAPELRAAMSNESLRRADDFSMKEMARRYGELFAAERQRVGREPQAVHAIAAKPERVGHG